MMMIMMMNDIIKDCLCSMDIVRFFFLILFGIALSRCVFFVRSLAYLLQPNPIGDNP